MNLNTSCFLVLVLLKSVCIEATDATGCESNPVDILFLLDSSGSMGLANFAKEKEFVARFAQAFQIGPMRVQIGAATFSDFPKHQFNLNTYADNASLVKQIYNISYDAGMTRTDLALKYVQTHGFTKASGDRVGAANILIVMTDGRSTVPALTTVEIQKIHQMKIKVFAIGIGAGVDKAELDHIATDGQHVFQVQNFDDLNTLQTKLKNTACHMSTTPITTSSASAKTTTTTSLRTVITGVAYVSSTKAGTTKTITRKTGLGSTASVASVNPAIISKSVTPPLPKRTDIRLIANIAASTMYAGTAYVGTSSRNTAPGHSNSTSVTPITFQRCNSTVAADIVFIVDASGSVRAANFEKVLDFVGNTIDSFPISSSETHIGLVTFDSHTYLQFHLNKYTNKTDVKNAVSATRYTAGLTETAEAIKYVRETSFTTQYGMRPGAAKIAIIVTDGQSNSPPATASEAALLRKDGITVFSIGVGTRIMTSELNAMATDPDSTHVFQVNDFDSLIGLKGVLVNLMCKGITTPTSTTSSTGASTTNKTSFRPVITGIAYVSTTEAGSTNTITRTTGLGNTHAGTASVSTVNPAVTIKSASTPLPKRTSTSLIATVAASSIYAGTTNIGTSSRNTTHGHSNSTSITSRTSQRCNSTVAADIVFIVDSSGSVGAAHFQKVLDFVGNIVDSFPISPSETHIGLVTFSTRTYLQFHLSTYTNKNDVNKAVAATRYTTGSTATAKALQYVRETSFTTQNGMRPGAAKIAIIVTDGVSDNSLETRLEAALLKKAGITVFSIGVGSRIRALELNTMATDPYDTHVFQGADFDSLIRLKGVLVNLMCKEAYVIGTSTSTSSCTALHPTSKGITTPTNTTSSTGASTTTKTYFRTVITGIANVSATKAGSTNTITRTTGLGNTYAGTTSVPTVNPANSIKSATTPLSKRTGTSLIATVAASSMYAGITNIGTSSRKTTHGHTNSTSFTSRTSQNGGWSRFGSFLACTKTCGGGSHTRVRTCTNPAPVGSGRQCLGYATETKSCNTQACPVLTSTGSTSTATSSVGNVITSFGYVSTTDSGTTVPSNVGSSGNTVTGTSVVGTVSAARFSKGATPLRKSSAMHTTRGTRLIATVSAVDGGWSHYGNFGTCTKSCGGGWKTRVRTCTNPSPTGGGRDCVGRAFDVQPCNTQPCPNTATIVFSTMDTTTAKTPSMKSFVDKSVTDEVTRMTETASTYNSKIHVIICLVIGSTITGVYLISIIARKLTGDKPLNKLTRGQGKVVPIPASVKGALDF